MHIKQADSEKFPGLIRLSVEQVFAYILDDDEKDFLMTISYVEISGERIYDLFDCGKLASIDQI